MSIRMRTARRLLDAGFVIATLGAGVALGVNIAADRVRGALPAGRDGRWSHLSAVAGTGCSIAICVVLVLAAAAEILKRTARR